MAVTYPWQSRAAATTCHEMSVDTPPPQEQCRQQRISADPQPCPSLWGERMVCMGCTHKEHPSTEHLAPAVYS